MKDKKNVSLLVAQGAIIAALYVVLTLVFAPISFGPMQVRIAENRWLVPLPTVLSNGIIVPLVLRYGYGVDMPLPLIMLYVTIGEIIGCYILGELFASVLLKNRALLAKFGQQK